MGSSELITSLCIGLKPALSQDQSARPKPARGFLIPVSNRTPKSLLRSSSSKSRRARYVVRAHAFRPGPRLDLLRCQFLHTRPFQRRFSFIITSGCAPISFRAFSTPGSGKSCTRIFPAFRKTRYSLENTPRRDWTASDFDAGQTSPHTSAGHNRHSSTAESCG